MQTRTDQQTNSEATMKLILVNRFRTAIHDRILHMSLKNNKIIHNIQFNHRSTTFWFTRFPEFMKS